MSPRTHFEATLKRRFKKASEGRIGKYLRLVRRKGRQLATVARHERILTTVEGGEAVFCSISTVATWCPVTADNVEQVPNGDVRRDLRRRA